jgi:hypothetical protein
VTAPSNVTRIHEHVCTYRLFVNGAWICASQCHYGELLSLVAPGPKGRAA